MNTSVLWGKNHKTLKKHKNYGRHYKGSISINRCIWWNIWNVLRVFNDTLQGTNVDDRKGSRSLPVYIQE